MAILNFDKPKKVRPTEEHNRMYTSDSGVAGTYVPNMSREDLFRWKAKQIGGTDPRIEIRKTFSRNKNHAQVLIVVRPETIQMSANGKIEMSRQEFVEFQSAVQEAQNLLY